VTRTPLSRSKGQRSRLPGRFTHRGLNASGSCSSEHGNILGVRNYCYVAVCSAALCASASIEGGEGRGISWLPAAYRLFYRKKSFRYSLQNNRDEPGSQGWIFGVWELNCRVTFLNFVLWPPRIRSGRF